MKKTKINIDHDLEYSKFNRFVNENENLKTKGLYIYGDADVGKTSLARFLLKSLQNNNKYFINIQEWIALYQYSWKQNDFDGINIKPAEVLQKKEVLVLDDLGAEYIHNSTATYIYKLLVLRYEYIKSCESCITIITSNYSVLDLEKIYLKMLDNQSAKRLISRLKGIVDIEIRLDGKDKRIKSEDKEIIFSESIF